MSNVKNESALGELITDSLAEQTQASQTPEFKEKAAFSERTTRLRAQMLGLCQLRAAKGLVAHSDFNDVFNAVQKIWLKEPHDHTGAEDAFKAVEAALLKAEEKVEAHLLAIEQLRLAMESYELRRQALQGRIDDLVKGGFAVLATFASEKGVVDDHYDREDVTGEPALQALAALEALILQSEAAAEATRLYGQTLQSARDRVTQLKQDEYIGDGDLDEAELTLAEAEEAGTRRDFDGGKLLITKAGGQMDKVAKRAALSRTIDENRDGLLDRLVTSSLESVKATRSDVETLQESQLAELLLLQFNRAKATKTQQIKIGVQIRELYVKFLEANAEEEEEDEEDTPPPPVETQAQKRTRIHEAKLRRKSIDTLILMNAEGEIFKTVRVFANQGADFKVGNTGKPGDYVKDWVEGWDVQLKRGRPTDPAGNCQYERMIVHVHYSDKNYTNVQRMHFKNNHAAADHGHVLVGSSLWGPALLILKNNLP